MFVRLERKEFLGNGIEFLFQEQERLRGIIIAILRRAGVVTEH